MNVAPAMSALHPDLTEKDLENARAMLEGLLEDVRRREREKQLLAAIVTWANAFSSFKRLRKNVGLPIGSLSSLYYGGFVASLKATGKMLLAWVEKENCDPAMAGIKKDDLNSAVSELIEDDLMLDSGMLTSDFSDYEKRFCQNA